MDGRPFSLSQDGESKTPGRSPSRWGRSHKTRPRSGLLIPRVAAARSAAAAFRRLSYDNLNASRGFANWAMNKLVSSYGSFTRGLFPC